MFLFRTETKRVGGSALHCQEYGEYPGEKSQVFQERRQKSDQSSLGIWQRARSGRVCSAVELSDLRRQHLKSRQNISFSSVWPRSEQRRYSRSERIYESSAIGGAGGRGWNFGQRQPSWMLRLLSLQYRLLLFVAEGGKYPLRAQYILAETTRWVSL